jgi:hypothetical protein
LAYNELGVRERPAFQRGVSHEGPCEGLGLPQGKTPVRLRDPMEGQCE